MQTSPYAGGPIWRRFAKRLSALVLGVAVSFSSAHADGLPDLGDVSAADLSPSMERRLGESIMRDIRQREPTYLDDPELEGYVNEIGFRLAANADEVGGAYRFFVIKDSAINAFAMFGGFIGVNTGLIMTAQTESELAGVLAHEISHVSQRHLARQIGKEKQVALASVLAIGLALVAARSNTDVIGATLAASQAASIQSQLAFSRDFEREADRAGFDLLEKAGYDVSGMVQFFERLQRATRIYENGMPVYMRTHPVTTERLSDMEARAHKTTYRQVPSSLDFHLVRAKLAAQQGTPKEAVADFERLLRDKKLASDIAGHYGYSLALQRDGQLAAAQQQLALVTQGGVSTAMVERLAAELAGQQGNWAGAVARYEAALQRFPSAAALRYGYAEALVASRMYEKARRFLVDAVQQYASDPKLFSLLAQVYSALGRQAAHHRAQAELYLLNGQLVAAIEQLQLAQRLKTLDFYEQSAIEARLRELRSLQAEEAKQRQKNN
jgi:beta-barrel assembly-enhancing protease